LIDLKETHLKLDITEMKSFGKRNKISSLKAFKLRKTVTDSQSILCLKKFESKRELKRSERILFQ